MKKILVIDQHFDDLPIYNVTLKNHLGNYKLLAATSGKDGIKMAKDQQPDVILLDIMIPIEDGFEICQLLKDDDLTKNIPIIIIITTDTGSDERIKALDMGADAFLSKPINPIDLLSQINVVLRIKEAEDNLRNENHYQKSFTEEQISKRNKSETNYRVVFEGSTDGVVHINKNLDVINVNKSFTEITGIAKEDVIGKSGFKLAKKFLSVRQLPKVIGVLKDMLLNKEVTAYELNYKSKILEIVPKKQDSDYTIAIIRDITNQKIAEKKLIKSEERFRMMILNSPDLTLIQNPSGELVYISPQAKDVLGHKGDKFLYQKFPEYIHPEDREDTFKQFEQALRGEEIHDFEYRFIDDKNQIQWLSHTTRAVKDNDKIINIQSSIRNITKQKHIQEKLLENEFYLTKAQDIGVFGSWRLDIQNNILKWTEENYKIFGVPLGTKMTDEVFINCIYPEDRDFVNEKWQAAINGATYDIEHRLLVDNKIKWVREKADVEFDDNGNAIKATGITQDITKYKLVEKGLETSEKMYRQLFELLPYGGEVIDTKGIVINCSPSTGKLLGYNVEDIIGKSITEFLAPDSIKKFKDKFLQFVVGESMADDICMIRKDGKKLQVLRAAQPIVDDNGMVTSILSLNIDVTDRRIAESVIKESEERLKILFESAPDAYYLSDLKGVFIDGNIAAEEMLGYKREELIGKSFLSLKILSAEDIHIAGKILAKNIRGKKSGPDEFTLNRKDGEQVKVEISAYPVKIKNKTVVLGIARNITERKKAETALVESEEKYRNLVERANDGICIVQDGLIKFANSSLIKLYGGKAKSLIGSPFTKFVHPDELERLKKYNKLRFAGAKGVPSIYKTILLHKKGYNLYVEFNAEIINYLGKKANLIIIRDISESRESEEKIRKLSKAVEQSPSIIIITGTDGRIEYVNPKFTEVTNHTFEESIGKLPNILKPGFYSGDEYVELWDSISSGKTWHGEFHNKKKNGELFWEAASVSPIFDENGKITNYIKVAEEISERKRSEQIQKVLFNISNAVITSSNLKNLLETIRAELATIIDTTNFYVATYDQNSDTLVLPYLADERESRTSIPAAKTLTYHVIKTQKSLLATKKSIKKLEDLGHVGKSGEDSDVWLGVPLKVEGEVIGVLAVQSYKNENAYNESDMEMLEFVADQISISINSKKAEDELVKALERANESDRLKSAFLANMSHEIRTPMNGIMGFANLLKVPDLSREQLIKYVSIINRSGDRMLNIINDLIDISRIEAGQMEIKISECNINNQIEYLHKFFEPETRKKQLIFNYKTTLSSSEAIINTDKEKLYAVLTNLIKNAIKYTHEGSISFGYERKGDNLEFYVRDTGIGVPKERHEAIFERFIQADIEDRNVYEGAGLGLSITKAYVNMMGGDIWFDSVEGEGSQFYFTIPIITNEKKSILNQLKVGAEPKLITKKLKILIAEDDEFADIYLTVILKEISSKIIHAENGQEAVRLCNENKDLDLILMDIKMPDMNGYQAIEEIRKFNEDVVIIAQTAYAMPGDRKKALEVGSNDYIAKPVDKDELMKIIVKHF